MQKTPVEKTLNQAPAAVASSPVPDASAPLGIGDTTLRSDIPTAPADEAGGGSLPAYTAGPYSVRVRPAGIYSPQAHIVDGPNGFPLAVLEGYSGYEREANAHLFKAAPDLLAALRPVADPERADDDGETVAILLTKAQWEAARSAIARATGAA